MNKIGLWIALAFILGACSSTTGPVVIRDASTGQTSQSTVNTPAPVTSTGNEDTNIPENNNTVAIASPVVPDQPRNTLPLVERLISDANKHYQQKRFEKAISVAERGLRVDRKEPRLYLVLAKAYREQANEGQSRQFARQGLRYANKGTEEYRALSFLSLQ